MTREELLGGLLKEQGEAGTETRRTVFMVPALEARKSKPMVFCVLAGLSSPVRRVSLITFVFFVSGRKAWWVIESFITKRHQS